MTLAVGRIEIITVVDLTSFEAALVDYAAATGRECAEVVTDQARLFTRDVMKATPPFETFGNFDESWAAQRRAGLGAIEGDIRRGFQAFEELSLFESPRNAELGANFRKAVRGNKPEAARAILKNARILDIKPDRIVAQPTPERHNRLRNQRGRVYTRLPYPFWTLLSRPVDRFVRDKQKLVGRLKAGWLAAAIQLGVKGIPQWIQSQRAEGSIGPLPRYRDNDPRILIVNTVPYVGFQNQEHRFVALALKERTGSMRRALEARTAGLWGKRR